MLLIFYFYFELGNVYDRCERQGINITNVDEGIIRSERYPSMYPPNRFCIWRIIVSIKRRNHIGF